MFFNSTSLIRNRYVHGIEISCHGVVRRFSIDGGRDRIFKVGMNGLGFEVVPGREVATPAVGGSGGCLLRTAK